jgi:hypothetical protein
MSTILVQVAQQLIKMVLQLAFCSSFCTSLVLMFSGVAGLLSWMLGSTMYVETCIERGIMFFPSAMITGVIAIVLYIVEKKLTKRENGH